MRLPQGYFGIPLHKLLAGPLLGMAIGLASVARVWFGKILAHPERVGSRAYERPSLDYYFISLLVILAWTCLGGLLGWLVARKSAGQRELEEYAQEFPKKDGRNP